MSRDHQGRGHGTGRGRVMLTGPIIVACQWNCWRSVSNAILPSPLRPRAEGQPRRSMVARPGRVDVLDLHQRDPRSKTRGGHCQPSAIASTPNVKTPQAQGQRRPEAMTVGRRGWNPAPSLPHLALRPHRGSRTGGSQWSKKKARTYRPRSVSSLLILFSAIVSGSYGYRGRGGETA